MVTLLLLIILTSTTAATDFNYTLARAALDYAAAAYAVKPLGCAIKQNASVVFRTRMPCDLMRDECWAVIMENEEWITVSFRGTRSKIQLIFELLETMGEPKHKLRAGGSVQHYFYVALQSIWDSLERILRKLNRMSPNRPVLFTGHSLGGALASIASTIFAHKYPDTEVHLITFGEPRAGNLEFANVHNRLVKTSWRVVHKYDLVAHIPYCYERLLSHSCSPLYNHGPWHHGTEIWFPTEMNSTSEFRICEGQPTNEDDSCSNSAYIHYGILDHLFYFDEYVSEYGDDGCVSNRGRFRR